MVADGGDTTTRPGNRAGFCVGPMDQDEIDFAILDLYEYGEYHGVSAAQMARRLLQAISDAYLVVSEQEDRLADEPAIISTALH